MAADNSDHVYLDLRHLDPDSMRDRFPTISKELAAHGLDFARDLIPVAPAAHYFMGGIVAGETGQTSLPGLLAIGEAACTGVHGANRLASNSLLEGLVFGLEAADKLNREHISSLTAPSDFAKESAMGSSERERSAIKEVRATLRQTMSQHVGVVRDAEGLSTAAKTMVEILSNFDTGKVDRSRKVWELVNMATAASAIVHAAIRRQESRGAHFRSDYPERNPDLDRLHFIVGGDEIRWRLGSLAEARAPVPVLA
jgi:L-aspartate oxidase